MKVKMMMGWGQQLLKLQSSWDGMGRNRTQGDFSQHPPNSDVQQEAGWCPGEGMRYRMATDNEKKELMHNTCLLRERHFHNVLTS